MVDIGVSILFTSIGYTLTFYDNRTFATFFVVCEESLVEHPDMKSVARMLIARILSDSLLH